MHFSSCSRIVSAAALASRFDHPTECIGRFLTSNPQLQHQTHRVRSSTTATAVAQRSFPGHGSRLWFSGTGPADPRSRSRDVHVLDVQVAAHHRGSTHLTPGIHSVEDHAVGREEGDGLPEGEDLDYRHIHHANGPFGYLVPMTDEDLLTPAEVGKLLRVNPKTVTRWARAGKIQCIRTLGGHRRFRRADVQAAILAAQRPGGVTATDPASH